MRKQKVTFDAVRAIGLRLPDVEEGTMYGSPALKVRGNLLACLAVHKSAEPDTLAVRIDFGERDDLVDADPKTYYLTEHYVDYPVVPYGWPVFAPMRSATSRRGLAIRECQKAGAESPTARPRR
jgi:hypothetical protein